MALRNLEEISNPENRPQINAAILPFRYAYFLLNEDGACLPSGRCLHINRRNKTKCETYGTSDSTTQTLDAKKKQTWQFMLSNDTPHTPAFASDQSDLSAKVFYRYTSELPETEL